MKRLKWPAQLLVAIVAFVPLLANVAGAQWVDVSPGIPHNLYGAQFFDSNNGYAVGWNSTGGIILNTTDGGLNWNNVQYDNTLLFSIYFRDNNNGLSVGYYAGCNCAVLLGTVDGGLNWNGLTYNGSFGFYEMAAPGNGTTVYTGGYQGVIVKSTDGGLNWVTLQTGTTDVFRLLEFPTEQVGYGIAGEGSNFSQPSKVYRTTDAGTTWELVQDFMGSRIFGDVAFTSAGVGHGAGWEGSAGIFKTTDLGVTWKRTYSGPNEVVFQSIYFADEHNGYAVGSEGRIVTTTDGGETWTEEERFTNAILSGVTIAGDAVYIVGFDGVIYKKNLGSISNVPGVGSVSPKQFTVRGGTGSITIQPNSGTIQGYSAQLFDVLGNRLYQTEMASGSVEIPTREIASGMYFYAIHYETEPGKVAEEGVVVVR